MRCSDSVPPRLVPPRPAPQDPLDPTVDALRHVLGNTCRLALTTLNAHWNVGGPAFFGLHAALEAQYRELWDALDGLGERVRALGGVALADHTDRLVVPVFASDAPPDTAAMLASLVEGHHEMMIAIGAAMDVARAADDEATIALLGERLGAHGQYRWQLAAAAAT